MEMAFENNLTSCLPIALPALEKVGKMKSGAELYLIKPCPSCLERNSLSLFVF